MQMIIVKERSVTIANKFLTTPGGDHGQSLQMDKFFTRRMPC